MKRVSTMQPPPTAFCGTRLLKAYGTLTVGISFKHSEALDHDSRSCFIERLGPTPVCQHERVLMHCGRADMARSGGLVIIFEATGL